MVCRIGNSLEWQWLNKSRSRFSQYWSVKFFTGKKFPEKSSLFTIYILHIYFTHIFTWWIHARFHHLLVFSWGLSSQTFSHPFFLSSFYSLSDYHRIWSSKNHRMKDVISCRDGLWNLMHKWIHILTWRLEFRFKIFCYVKIFHYRIQKILEKFSSWKF